MNSIELCKRQAEIAYSELLESIDITQEKAWGVVELQPNEYLHSEGSILSIVVHVAAGKLIYGSCAYRDLEIRWRDTVEQINAFWPSWDGAKEYLQRSHEYWTESWASENDPERLVMRFDGQMWQSWKIIDTVIGHDRYHAGQIQVLRASVAPSQEPPPSEAELWRKYCEPLPSW